MKRVLCGFVLIVTFSLKAVPYNKHLLEECVARSLDEFYKEGEELGEKIDYFLPGATYYLLKDEMESIKSKMETSFDTIHEFIEVIAIEEKRAYLKKETLTILPDCKGLDYFNEEEKDDLLDVYNGVMAIENYVDKVPVI